MRVFILCTGRSGSKSFIKAAQHIENYTAAHESRVTTISENRVHYPPNHIEADNRLTWFIGLLEEKYGKDAFYVHLLRDRERTIQSFLNRWNEDSIIWSFVRGVLMSDPRKMTSKQKYEACNLYYDTVNKNIELFLRDKPMTLTIRLSTIEKDFSDFCEKIDAEVDIDGALEEFRTPHNASSNSLFPWRRILYKIKLFLKSFSY